MKGYSCHRYKDGDAAPAVNVLLRLSSSSLKTVIQIILVTSHRSELLVKDAMFAIYANVHPGECMKESYPDRGET